MSATITIPTTTLRYACDGSQLQINLTSTASIGRVGNGVTNGTFLYVTGQNPGERGELMQVLSLGIVNGSDNWVNVLRGLGGTEVRRHSSGSTVFVGQPDYFFQNDPQGMPPNSVYVQPHINVVNGKVWVLQGDESDTTAVPRWWAIQNTTPGIGALGVRTVTDALPVSSS